MQEAIAVLDNCMKNEFKAIGYDQCAVNKKFAENMTKLETNYTSLYVKIDDDLDEERRGRKRFGAKIVYNGVSRLDRVVKQFINSCRPNKKLRLVSIPSRKLKNRLFTRKNYLKKQRSTKN